MILQIATILIAAGVALFVFFFLRDYLRDREEVPREKKPVKKIQTIGTIAVIVLIVMGTVIVTSCVTVIGAGEVGVKFNPLADGVQEDTLGEGLHFKRPWVSIEKYNIKAQEYTMSVVEKEGEIEGIDTIKVLTIEGLDVDIDLTLIFRVIPDTAWKIRKEVGREGEYQKSIIRPIIRGQIRDVVAKYKAEELYSTKREVFGIEVQTTLETAFAKYYIMVDRVEIRDIDLPDPIKNAIQAKMEAQQRVQQKEWEYEEAKVEARRKIEEAKGIAEANLIIGESLTLEYLSWYWLDHLKDHTSVIYVPITQQGFPVLTLPVNEYTEKPE